MWLKICNSYWLNSDKIIEVGFGENLCMSCKYIYLRDIEGTVFEIREAYDLDRGVDVRTVRDNIVNQAFAMPGNTVLSAELLPDGTIKPLLMHGGYLEEWLHRNHKDE